MERNSKICVIGIGLIGEKIVEQLRRAGYQSVTPCRHADLELLNQRAVDDYFREHKWEYVFFCAVKAISDFESGSVGDAEEAYANIMMQCNVMQAAHIYGVKKLLLLGSAMLYPWNLPENRCLDESQLENFNLPGYRETMQAAVLGKLVGFKLCQYYHRQYGSAFYYCLPTHIYGGFEGRKSLYFLERLVIAICEAAAERKEELCLDVFGEGKAKKQFLYAGDCAEAILRVMNAYEGPGAAINICGEEVSCWKSIVDEICLQAGYGSKILFRSERKENMANRLCSPAKLKALGWEPQVDIKEGIHMLCSSYQNWKEGNL